MLKLVFDIDEHLLAVDEEKGFVENVFWIFQVCDGKVKILIGFLHQEFEDISHVPFRQPKEGGLLDDVLHRHVKLYEVGQAVVGDLAGEDVQADGSLVLQRDGHLAPRPRVAGCHAALRPVEDESEIRLPPLGLGLWPPSCAAVVRVPEVGVGRLTLVGGGVGDGDQAGSVPVKLVLIAQGVLVELPEVLPPGLQRLILVDNLEIVLITEKGVFVTGPFLFQVRKCLLSF